MTDIPHDDDEAAAIVAFPLPDDSHILTFDLERANVRGRIVRLGRVLDDILTPHHYPDMIERHVVETITLALLLSSMLKYKGIFILQAQGDGVVRRLVSDVTSDLEVRATAGFDAESLATLLADNPQPSLKELFGHGYLAFTVDQGEFTERYQGIVELVGDSLEDSIHHYFAQSEQIGTAIKLSASKNDKGEWKTGAVMLQYVPDYSNIPQDAKPISDGWARAQMLLATCSDEELLDIKLHDNTLLFRLFHEEGVRVFKPEMVTKACRCTLEKLQGVLEMLSSEDRDHAAQDGKITMTCEFCNKDFCFDHPQEDK